MTTKQSNWKIDVCPNCHSAYFVWIHTANPKNYIYCHTCKKESPEPKTIEVVEK